MNMIPDGQRKKVVIAGGGTAGWITAAALASKLGSLIDIVLVESDAIGTIGVGEATIPTHRSYHDLIGVDEVEFMKATQSTFKLGIQFEGWRRPGDAYFHAFGELGPNSFAGGFHHTWYEAARSGDAGSLDDYCPELRAALANRFAHLDRSPLSYAYHLEASGYAKFLRRFGEERGVERIEGRIDHVEQKAESGAIAALVLDDGQRLEGDLFVDCTGFRGLLVRQALGERFIDWSHWLPMDRAVAVQCEAERAPVPYTRAIAHPSGWQWQIPLRHRVGNGLVYCSSYLDEQKAWDTLVTNLPGAPLSEPNHIRFTTGRLENAWVKNCVAVGLSTGFVEPLESTSIHLIQTAATRLVQMFPFGNDHEALRRLFNRYAADELDRVRDFVVLHYKLNERTDDSFWQDRQTATVPDSLAERIELFRQSGVALQEAGDLFRVDSWVQVMRGQGLEPQAHHPLAATVPAQNLDATLLRFRQNVAQQVSKLPLHADYLDRYLG